MFNLSSAHAPRFLLDRLSTSAWNVLLMCFLLSWLFHPQILSSEEIQVWSNELSAGLKAVGEHRRGASLLLHFGKSFLYFFMGQAYSLLFCLYVCMYVWKEKGQWVLGGSLLSNQHKSVSLLDLRRKLCQLVRGLSDLQHAFVTLDFMLLCLSSGMSEKELKTQSIGKIIFSE